MAAPKKYNGTYTRISLNVPDNLLVPLDAKALSQGVDRTDLIHDGIRRVLCDKPRAAASVLD